MSRENEKRRQQLNESVRKLQESFIKLVSNAKVGSNEGDDESELVDVREQRFDNMNSDVSQQGYHSAVLAQQMVFASESLQSLINSLKMSEILHNPHKISSQVDGFSARKAKQIEEMNSALDDLAQEVAEGIQEIEQHLFG